MKKKNLSLSALGLMSLSLLAACGSQDTESGTPPVRPVLSMVVGDVEAVRVATYPGRAQAVQEVNIGFEVPGKMLSRPVDVGSQVKAGDVLATLDQRPYAASVRTLEGQLVALKANLENAKADLERSEKLAVNNFATQARVDDETTRVRATEANIEATNGQLDAARLNLNYTTLIAPFDGTVSETFIDNFQNVNARQPVLRLLDTSQIEMEIAVPENLINLEPYVEGIEVEFSSLPGIKIPAQIARVGNEASTTTRTYPVTIIMSQPDNAVIQPGMAGLATAKVKVPGDLGKSGVQIPTSAIFSPSTSDPSETFVWIIDGTSNQVSRKPVKVETFTERGLIVTGLNAGERIATAGVNTLVEGQKVHVQKAAE